MTDLRQAAQQALEALERYQVKRQDFDRFADEITALRTALEQQAEPPPEWPLIKNILAVFGLDAISFVAKWQAAQQAEPPQREWQGLTDGDWSNIEDRRNTSLDTFQQGVVWAADILKGRNK